MQVKSNVEWIILQYFWPALSDHLRQALLYNNFPLSDISQKTLIYALAEVLINIKILQLVCLGAPLSPPVKYCYWPSKAVPLLWIIYVSSVFFCYAFMHVCLLMLCGRLLGKGWLLGSRLWCLIVTLSLSHWYPGSGVVLDCIDSWSLPYVLLCLSTGP